jgi:epoxyqueuosine reductase QueG
MNSGIMDKANNQRVLDYARELGFSLVGVADVAPLRGGFLLHERLKGRFPRAVSLAKRLSDAVLDDIDDKPTPLYFHHYRQTNYFLDRAAFLLADLIQSLGFASLAVPASQLVDWEKHRGHVSHKAVALAAGLGWIGRNNLLVTREHGSRVRLVTVLTDMPLEPGGPLAFGCGDCVRCLAPCPAGAIGMDPAAFDHIRCYEQLVDFRNKHVVSQHICGVCVKACTVNP